MKKIALLTWWTWLERQIAFKSALFFEENLEHDFDKYDLPNELEKFIKNKDKYSHAIPVFHWEYWEDWKIFALLDTLGISHSFSDYKTHALCLDKEKTNVLVSQLWIKVPFQYIASNNKSFPNTYPVIMKPNHGGSSFHTYKVNDKKEFSEFFNETRKDLEDDILIQEFIVGDEYSVPIVGGKVLPIMKVEKNDIQDFFDYDSKYESEEKMKETFPVIEKELKNNLESISLRIYNYFWIKWCWRIDFLVRNNEIFFLEINTIPWMTSSSILPKSWKLTGRSSKELVNLLINNL